MTRKKNIPLVKGGQGRSVANVKGAANNMAITIMFGVLVMLFVLIRWG